MLGRWVRQSCVSYPGSIVWGAHPHCGGLRPSAPHADDGLNAFSLPELRLKAQAGRTKGSSAFSWDDATSSLAVASKRRCTQRWRPSGLARAARKCPADGWPASSLHHEATPLPPWCRLLLFQYDGLEFAPQREVSLADSVHSMRFAGGTLYVAMAKG